MGDAMVTGRMASEKKSRGGRILQQNGLSGSQAINLMYDRLIEEGDAAFLVGQEAAYSRHAWETAAEFVDALSAKQASRFDSMTKAEIRSERLRNRGLM